MIHHAVQIRPLTMTKAEEAHSREYKDPALWAEIDAWRKVADDFEREVRKMLWLGHTHTQLYGDDGEMQCNQCTVDYRRSPLEDIRSAAGAARIAYYYGKSEVAP